MLIIIAMMIVMIWAQILTWLYATINPFIDQLWNIQRYNVAYYGAISSVERAYLTLRWHEAWFEWSGWRIWTNTFWNSSDHNTDIKTMKYRWQLTLDNFKNWMSWDVRSMTDWTVPKTWRWNLDWDISSGNNAQMLWFWESLQYAFYRDNSKQENYYTHVKDTDIVNISITQNLKIDIKVPEKLKKNYNVQNWGNVLNIDTDLDNDTISDDVIVNRSLFGYTWDDQFTIFPTMDVIYASATEVWKVNTNDTTIRESDVNRGEIEFRTISTLNDSTNPSWRAWNPPKFNQSPIDAVSAWFWSLLNANPAISKMNLKLSLVNFLKQSDDNIYPYLEVKLNTNWVKIPWLEYDIVWRWKAWEYDVKIFLQKPIFRSSAASDFTVLF